MANQIPEGNTPFLAGCPRCCSSRPPSCEDVRVAAWFSAGSAEGSSRRLPATDRPVLIQDCRCWRKKSAEVQQKVVYDRRKKRWKTRAFDAQGIRRLHSVYQAAARRSSRRASRSTCVRSLLHNGRRALSGQKSCTLAYNEKRGGTVVEK
ncbi:hypothetical protein LIA77_03854 [Sarocladium implicatum]|nr:hypothetical protein LIA77_03854 [Sarocladium implicatum]